VDEVTISTLMTISIICITVTMHFFSELRIRTTIETVITKAIILRAALSTIQIQMIIMTTRKERTQNIFLRLEEAIIRAVIIIIMMVTIMWVLGALQGGFWVVAMVGEVGIPICPAESTSTVRVRKNAKYVLKMS
jgi:hypothetical protein